jgi:hypothetical protein
MTSLETCIREAVENGGYPGSGYFSYKSLGAKQQAENYMLLDPLFWQSLGRARGWHKEPFAMNGAWLMADSEWKLNWFRFIDHLAEGKDAESFFAAL